MSIAIQRVQRTSVAIGGQVKSVIGKGYFTLFDVCADDTEGNFNWLVKRGVSLRVFDGERGVMLPSLMDVEGGVLVVNQFTLFASCKKSNRPSWIKVAPRFIGIPLYELFCRRLSEAMGREAGSGKFGADMKVELLNDGPVTICMDTKNKE